MKTIICLLAVLVLSSCKEESYSNYYPNIVKSLKSMNVKTITGEGKTDYGLLSSYKGEVSFGNVVAEVNVTAT